MVIHHIKQLLKLLLPHEYARVYHPVSFQAPRELVITFQVLLVSEGSWLGLFSWGVGLGPHLFAVCQKVTERIRLN